MKTKNSISKKRSFAKVRKRTRMALSTGTFITGLAITLSVFGATTQPVAAPHDFEELLEPVASPTVLGSAFIQSNIPETPSGGWLTVNEYIVTATGYSSTLDQTNEDPFITASGSYVHWGIVAVSRDLFEELCKSSFPCATHLRIPSLFPDTEIFIIEDLMHQRKKMQIDVWFPTRSQAQRFGIHYGTLIQVVEKIE